MPSVLTTMPWTGAAAGELVASCSPPWPSPGSSRTAPAGRSRSSSHRVPLPHHLDAMGVRLAERLTRRTRQLRDAPSPQDRPPGSAAPTRRPARRHSVRLSEDRHPLRRDHRLGPSPRGSSLTMKTWDVCCIRRWHAILTASPMVGPRLEAADWRMCLGGWSLGRRCLAGNFLPGSLGIP